MGLFLQAQNLAVHRFYLKPGGAAFVNTGTPGNYLNVDAKALAQAQGFPPVAANLILLGYAAAQGGLFCAADLLAGLIQAKTPPRFRDSNLNAFHLGVKTAAP